MNQILKRDEVTSLYKIFGISCIKVVLLSGTDAEFESWVGESRKNKK